MRALKKRVRYCYAREPFLNLIAFQTHSHLQHKVGRRAVIKALSGVWEHELEGCKSRGRGKKKKKKKVA